MNMTDSSPLWTESFSLETIIHKFVQLFVEFKQKVQSMNQKHIYLSFISIFLLILLYIHIFGTFSKTCITIDVNRHNLTKLIPVIDYNNQEYMFSSDQFSTQRRNHSENVIAFLVGSYTGDVRVTYNPYPKLCEKIFQLNERLNDNNVTDLLIFHTGYPFQSDFMPIIDGTSRLVIFVNIDHLFHKFSPGFNPYSQKPTWSKRGKWNYHQMCYFWFKHVFEMKIIQRYRYMMRLDDDSQILGKWPNIFDIMSKQQAVYLANFRIVDYEYVLRGITRIRDLVTDYITKNKIRIQNPAMYTDFFNHTVEIPSYWNNFEIVETSLMRQSEVAHFIRVVDESNGIFLYRWGDAPLRFITLALFTNESQILHRVKLKLEYCHPC